MKRKLYKIYLLLTLLLAIMAIEGFATPQYISVSGISSPSGANGIYSKAGTYRADLTGYASTGIYYDYWTYTNAGTTYYLYFHQYNASSYYWNIDTDLEDQANVLFYNSDNGGAGYQITSSTNAPVGAPVSPDLVSGWTNTSGTGVGTPIVTIPASSPTVTTTAASSISSTSATLGGNVTADGGATVTGRGVVYSTSDNTPTIAEGAAQVTIGSGTGSFSQSVSSLTPGTTYYFNAFATNSSGTSYGTATSFVTLPANNAPTDISLSASSINENVTANSTVGTLSSTDADAGNTFTYSLVAGTGSTDNASFNISGSSLRITSSPDFETKSSYSVRVRTTDQGSLTYEKAFTVTINDLNEAPTDVALSAGSINENVAANATVGTLSSTDADAANTFTYTLVAGTGSTDNASFNISGNSLRITNSPDYETKSSYSIRVRTTDQGSLTYEKAFTVTINDLNEGPTDVSLSASSVNENVAGNTSVGTLSTIDPDAGNTFTYSLVAGTGSTDNASFNISGSSLRITNSPDYETKSSYSVRIRTTDQGSIYYERAFTININDLNEAPTDISLSASSVNENVAGNTSVGTLSSTDLDAGNTFTYSLVAGTGSTDNASFNISGSSLRITASPDFETKSSYSVRVRTTDQGSLTYEKAFTVTINDLNEAPTDVVLSASSINENVTANSTVGTLSSTDADAANTFTYSLVAGTGSTDNASFNISGSSLRITASPDFETKSSYSIRVRTTDQGSLTNEKEFTVTINDLNEAPVVTPSQSFSISENSVAGTVVGSVVATDPDAGTIFSGWAITANVNPDGDGNSAFAIDASTGQISVADAGDLDREANVSLSIMVSVSDGTNTSVEESVTINLNDLNDVVPVITAAQAFSIDENLADGSVVGTILATDGDVIATTFSSWIITGGNTNEAFAIDAATGAITVNKAAELDREKVSSFNLTVTVSDGVNTSLAEVVTINLNDLNDVVPVITAAQAFSIDENLADGSAVGTILASDGDITPTTFSSWIITGGNTNDAFTIDAATGALTVNKAAELDRENVASFNLTVTVSDGVNTSPAETVTINLTDLNDVVPVITAAQAFSIDENLANGSAVGTILATDADVTATIYSSWTITGGNTNDAFAIDAPTGALTVNKAAELDREKVSSFNLTVTVSDGVNTSPAETVTINLTDLNDVVPVITAAQAFSIDENLANGSAVGTILATDGDVAPTTYSSWTIIGGNTNDAFAIDAATGAITVNKTVELDREKVSSFNLTVTVSDGVNTSATEAVTINLNDLNDVAPVVTAAQVFYVAEQSPNGTTVGTALATDGDVAATTFQNWTITAGNSSGYFAINSSTGEITVVDNTGLYPAVNPSFTLTLTVSDGANTSANQTVSIIVSALNDDTPVVTAAQSFAINENSDNGTTVGQVLATDPDYGTLFQGWAITAGNSNNAFAIDPATGVITVNQSSALDFETTTSFTLSVTVSDGVHTSAAEAVTINLNDVNDVVPVITAAQAFSIDENLADGSAVGTILATDGDVTATTFSSWTITGGNTNEAFAIDAATGAITVNKAVELDREKVSSFNLTVTVSDGVNTSLAETVTINLNDLIDVAPVVTAAQAFSIDENLANGSSVGTVQATDADVTATIYSSWTITGGNTNDAFAIDAATGAITVNKATELDRENVASFNLTVTVSDGVNTSPAEAVTINLNDLNDVAPVVTAAQVFYVTEQALNGTTVGTALATDGDVAATTFQNWTITGGNSGGYFAINSSTGVITVVDNTGLNTAINPSFTLTLTVSDGANTSVDQAVSIIVAAVNDDNPVVTAAQSFAINENSDNGSAVGQVLATDPDYGTLFQGWAITAGNTNSAFAIDPATGAITVNSKVALDREAVSSFNLSVTVSDGLHTSVPETVTINLNDVNDVAPVVTAVQPISISENLANATAVGTLVATDGDVTSTTFSSWTITAGNTNDAFAIDPATGAITVNNNVALDREVASSFNLSVTVSDGLNISAPETVTINLTDVNDVIPVITAVQPISIDENLANGTAVGTPVATDGDVTATTFSSWTITNGNTGNAFAIDPATGAITVNQSSALDFETTAAFTLSVTVSDGVNTSAVETITVNLNNLNDNTPEITSTSFEIDENSPKDFVVGKVETTDMDGNLNALTVTIKSGNTGDAFAYDNATGNLVVNTVAAVDFEVNPVFNLELEVSDGTLSSTKTVQVQLKDVVETGINEQLFSSISAYPNPCSGSLFIEIPVSVVVSDITITDVNGKLVYSEQPSAATGKHTLNMDALPQGIYFVVLQGNGAKKILRIVKQ